MGALLVGLSTVLARDPQWRQYRPSLPSRPAAKAADDPEALLVGFFLAVLALGGGTLFVLGGGDLMVLLLVIGLALVAFLAGGVYVAGRSHGHPHSHAVGEAIIVVGGIGLLAVAGWLIAAPWG